MHRVRALLSAPLALCLSMAGTAAFGQAAPSLQPRALAATCAQCHGTDGRAVPGESMVRLAGLPKDYIVAQMQAFRDGQRPATVMQQIAKGYSAQQIESMAGFFAAQKPQ